MGAVYEAIRIDTSERVAVKLLETKPDKHDENRRSRFRREASAAGALRSIHVPRILETGEDEATGLSFIVMERLLGEDLDKLLQRVRWLKPETALKIVAQACAGLVEAHGARIIHRDIKPANLFLARRPGGEIVVKILDFGIAKTKAEPEVDTTGLTRSGSTIGTPLYMSPEQARGLREISFATDIWSIGVVLYRCLAGRVPHQGIDAHGDLIIAISTKLAPPVQRFAPWVSPGIAAIVHRALRLNAESRFSDVGAMLAAMDAILNNDRQLDEQMLGPPSEEERAISCASYEEPTLEFAASAVDTFNEDACVREPTSEHLANHVDKGENHPEIAPALPPTPPGASIVHGYWANYRTPRHSHTSHAQERPKQWLPVLIATVVGIALILGLVAQTMPLPFDATHDPAALATQAHHLSAMPSSKFAGFGVSQLPVQLATASARNTTSQAPPPFPTPTKDVGLQPSTRVLRNNAAQKRLSEKPKTEASDKTKIIEEFEE